MAKAKAKAKANRKPVGAERAREVIAELRAVASTPGDVTVERKRLLAWGREELFPEWTPYPKRLPHDLTETQRAFVDAALASGELVIDLAYAGLFDYAHAVRRMLGMDPSGATDVEVEIAGKRAPLWWAVSAVASGHIDAAPVMAAWMTLGADARIAAWQEIVTGGAYDLLEPHALTSAEAGIPRTASGVAYRTRLFSLLANVALAMGAAGEELARTTLRELPDGGSPNRALPALLAVRRFTEKRGEKLPGELHALARTIRAHAENTFVFAEPIVDEIERGIG